MPDIVKAKNICPQDLNIFVWMSGFQNPLAHSHFNMLVSEWTSANKSPGRSPKCSHLI